MSPLFAGDTDIEQLSLVIRALGTPNEANWPTLSELPDYNKIEFPHCDAVPFEELVPDACAEAVSLLKRFLVYRSDSRIRAKDGLLHPYFYVQPLPCHHTDLPIPKRGKKVHNYEYDLDRPIRDSIIDPDLFSKICSAD
jgi:serine/threonine protein kinase